MTKVFLVGWESPGIFVYGGLGVFGLELSSALASMGYDVMWFGCSFNAGDHGLHETSKGFKVFVGCTVTDLGEANVVSMFAETGQLLRGFISESDIVIVNDWHLGHASMIARALGVPSLYYVHAVAGQPYELMSMLYSGCVVANSNLTRNIVRAVLDPALSNIYPPYPKPPIHVVYPATPRLPDPPESIVEKLLEEKKGFTVLVVARNQPNKNVAVAEEAVSLLRRRGYAVELVVVGRGWPREVKSEFIRYVGGVPDEELVAWYRVADVFVLPSSIEFFGLVALEAASQGLPVVLSESSGVREVLTSAPVFNPRDPADLARKIERLINSEDERRRLGEEVRRQACSRSWEQVARELLRYAQQVAIEKPS